MEITKTQLDSLLSEAKKAAHTAYAPYSKFRVGSSVLTDIGIFSGHNIENASSPLGICAERAALIHAHIVGARQIYAIAVWCHDATTAFTESNINNETMPCAACRQWFVELAPEAVVITNGSSRVFTVAELLPHPFRLRVNP
jgi:Cytidine deaminase